jgi:hypothetical protein
MQNIDFYTVGLGRPTWLYTLGIESGGRYWLPAIFANVGDPIAFVKRKGSRFASAAVEARLNEMAMRDGVEIITHLGHLFLPYSWIISVNPEAKPYCVATINRFQMREPAQVA